MTQRPRRPVQRRLPTRIVLAASLGVTLLAGLLPAAGIAADAPSRPRLGPDVERSQEAGAAADPATGIVPSVQYEDAMAHADDVIAFVPGDRVSVPFTPRAHDHWPIGGKAPRELPAGRLSGRAILEADARRGGDAAGSVTAPEPLVDQPAVDPAEVVDATGTSVTTIDTAAAPAPAAKGLFREVYGFLPYWELNSSSTTLNYDLLSTIAYFSVGVETDGDLLRRNSDGSVTTGWAGWTSSKMTSIIDAAHAKGTRVVLTITSFAWTSSQTSKQTALLGSSTARLNLARQAAAAVRDRGADGINLDFEPIASGYDDEFTALVRAVRAELDRIAPGYQLTFDTTGHIGNYPLEAATAPGGADAIFIMGYDYRTAGTKTVGSIDPLAGPAYDLAETVAAYTARVPASKLILGVPYYGRAWSTDTDLVNANNISGAKYGASVTAIYETAVELAAEHGRRWDSRESTPWVAYRRENCTSTYGCVTSWRQLYYDDATSLKARYDLVNRAGLRGAGMWALGYDGTRPELYQALADKFQNDTTPPLAGIRTLAPVQTSETFPVSWIGRDDRGIATYDVQVSVDGGPWRDWLRGTTETSAGYLGADGHGFAFRVRATDLKGNVGAWAVDDRWDASPAAASGGFGRVVADRLNVRTAADTAASTLGTATAGTIVAFTGGPVVADGYTWMRADLPVEEWAPVDGLLEDVWIAVSGGGETFVAAANAPNTTRVGLPSGVAPAVGARFASLAPARLLDTRSGIGLSGDFISGTPRTFQVAGRGGVPANATAVTGNLTLVGSTADGYVTLGPTVSANPTTSTLNAPRGDTRAVGVTVALGSGGTLGAVYRAATGAHTDLLFDVTGYFVAGTTGATYVPLDPARVLDTRNGTGLSGSFAHRTPRTVQVAGRGGVPADAVAITANVVVTRGTSGGYLAVGPTMTSRPTTSSLNLPKGDTRANALTVRLSGGTIGAVWVGASGSRAHVVLDVTGYFVNSGAGATYFPIAPVRVLDSRDANGLDGRLASRVPETFGASGRGTVPADAVAVTGTLTMTGQTAGGYLSLGPTATATPTTSTLNAPAGDTRANGVSVRLAATSLGIVYVGPSGSSSHAVLDVTGYYR